MKPVILAGLATALATAAAAQQFGGPDDQEYASELWSVMVERGLAGDDAVQAFPYAGTQPHGAMLETFYTEATIGDHTGALVIKRNYGPEDVTVDQVLESREDHLGAVTIMYRREDGYDPETGNWFYAKYLPDGTLDQNPQGASLAGLVGKGADAGCIACHQGADGGDYLFTTNAELD